jgi:CTP:molybdopterin cytidylyltransferase MocA
MHLTAVLLAAGAARRFGAPKLLAPWRGRPLWEHALAALTSAPEVAETLVVVAPGTPAPPARPRCRAVVNPEQAEGMGASLRAGVRAAAADTDAFLVALADMPLVPPGLIAALVACYGAGERPIVVPVHGGRRGHPVLIGAALRDELLAVRGDVGARGVLAAHPERVAEVATDDAGVLFDVDEPDDPGGAGDAPGQDGAGGPAGRGGRGETT